MEIIQGIESDAEEEAKTIEREAEEYAEQRIASAKAQGDGILKDAEEKAENQSTLIRKNGESKVTMEKRKSALKLRDRVLQETLDLARKKIREMIGAPEYSALLLDWIVEGAIGLYAEEAEVNTSLQEQPLITEELLKKAEEEVFRITGKKTRLTKKEGDPLPGQGVVLTASSGKIAYNNQVSTRFLRHQTEIRKLVYQSLFKD